MIKASLTVKADHYNDFINYLYTKLDDDLKKLAVNGMIGSFKPKARENWRSLCMGSPADRPIRMRKPLSSSATKNTTTTKITTTTMDTTTTTTTTRASAMTTKTASWPLGVGLPVELP